ISETPRISTFQKLDLRDTTMRNEFIKNLRKLKSEIRELRIRDGITFREHRREIEALANIYNWKETDETRTLSEYSENSEFTTEQLVYGLQRHEGQQYVVDFEIICKILMSNDDFALKQYNTMATDSQCIK